MSDFYSDLSCLGAALAERVGHATYQSAIRRYTTATPPGWMSTEAFLAQLERQTGIPLDDLHAGHTSLRGRAPARV